MAALGRSMGSAEMALALGRARDENEPTDVGAQVVPVQVLPGTSVTSGLVAFLAGVYRPRGLNRVLLGRRLCICSDTVEVVVLLGRVGDRPAEVGEMGRWLRGYVVRAAHG